MSLVRTMLVCLLAGGVPGALGCANAPEEPLAFQAAGASVQQAPLRCQDDTEGLAGQGYCAYVGHACRDWPASGTAGVTSWSDVTSASGLPAVKIQTASARDVDGDGFADVLYGADDISTVSRDGSEERWKTAELYVSCFGQTFYPLGLAGRTTGDTLLDWVSATTIADVDGDGLNDLVLAGHYRLQVLYNQGGLQFEAVTTDLSTRTYGTTTVPADGEAASIAVFDANHDGHKDIYVAMLVKGSNLAYVDFLQATASDVFLLGSGTRGTWTQPEVDPVLEQCTQGQTFAVNFITRAPFSLPDLLYTGRDFGEDCLLVLDDQGRPTASIETPEQGQMSFATMGVDHMFVGAGGDVLVGVAEWGAVPLMRVSGDTLTDESAQLDSGELTRVGWGITFTDANLDGHEDVVVAYGNGLIAPWGQVEVQEAGDASAKWLLNSLRYYEGTGAADPMWVDRSVPAGPLFTPGASGSDDIDALLADVARPEDVEALRLDFYQLSQVDFDRDGCPDLLTTPIAQYENDLQARFVGARKYPPLTTTTRLRNDCRFADRHWVAFELPDDPGAVLSLETDGGARYAQVKTSPGVAGVGDLSVLRFGLGADPVTITSVRVHWSDGTTQEFGKSFALDRPHRLSR